MAEEEEEEETLNPRYGVPPLTSSSSGIKAGEQRALHTEWDFLFYFILFFPSLFEILAKMAFLLFLLFLLFWLFWLFWLSGFSGFYDLRFWASAQWNFINQFHKPF